MLTLFLWALIEAYRTVPLKPATERGWKQKKPLTQAIYMQHPETVKSDTYGTDFLIGVSKLACQAKIQHVAASAGTC